MSTVCRLVIDGTACTLQHVLAASDKLQHQQNFFLSLFLPCVYVTSFKIGFFSMPVRHFINTFTQNS